MWKKERKIIDGLGKLYPKFEDCWIDDIYYTECRSNNRARACWVYMLCTEHLNQRIPSLEEYIRKNNPNSWRWYKEHFGME